MHMGFVCIRLWLFIQSGGRSLPAYMCSSETGLRPTHCSTSQGRQVPMHESCQRHVSSPPCRSLPPCVPLPHFRFTRRHQRSHDSLTPQTVPHVSRVPPPAVPHFLFACKHQHFHDSLTPYTVSRVSHVWHPHLASAWVCPHSSCRTARPTPSALRGPASTSAWGALRRASAELQMQSSTWKVLHTAKAKCCRPCCGLHVFVVLVR